MATVSPLRAEAAGPAARAAPINTMAAVMPFAPPRANAGAARARGRGVRARCPRRWCSAASDDIFNSDVDVRGDDRGHAATAVARAGRRAIPPTTASSGRSTASRRRARITSPLARAPRPPYRQAWAGARERAARVLAGPLRAPLFLLKNNGRCTRSRATPAASAGSASSAPRRGVAGLQPRRRSTRSCSSARAGSNGGRVVAVTAKTGRTRWSRKLPSRAESSPLYRSRPALPRHRGRDGLRAARTATAPCAGRPGRRVRSRARSRSTPASCTSATTAARSTRSAAPTARRSGEGRPTAGCSASARATSTRRRPSPTGASTSAARTATSTRSRRRRQARLAPGHGRLRLRVAGRRPGPRRAADGLHRLLRRPLLRARRAHRQAALGALAGQEDLRRGDDHRRPRVRLGPRQRTTWALGARTGKTVWKTRPRRLQPGDQRRPAHLLHRLLVALRARRSGRGRSTRAPAPARQRRGRKGRPARSAARRGARAVARPRRARRGSAPRGRRRAGRERPTAPVPAGPAARRGLARARSARTSCATRRTATATRRARASPRRAAIATSTSTRCAARRSCSSTTTATRTCGGADGPPAVRPGTLMPVNDLIPMPARAAKPRTSGLTHVLDGGLGPLEVQSLLAVGAAHIDLVRLGWGSALVTDGLQDKLDLYREAGVPVMLGGTLTELAWAHGRVDELAAWVQELGIDRIEVFERHGPHSRGREGAAHREARHADDGLRRGGREGPRRDPRAIRVGEPHPPGVRRRRRARRLRGPRERDRRPISRHVRAAHGSRRGDRARGRPRPARLRGAAAPPADLAHQPLRPEINLGNIPATSIVSLESLRLGLRSETVAKLHDV